jgi:hypothetical protein
MSKHRKQEVRRITILWAAATVAGARAIAVILSAAKDLTQQANVRPNNWSSCSTASLLHLSQILSLCTFALYIPMCYHASLSCQVLRRTRPGANVRLCNRRSLKPNQGPIKLNPTSNFSTPLRPSRISNRHFLVRLKTLLTHTKQTPETICNRHISDPPRQNELRFSTPLPPPLSATFNWNFPPPWGEYVTTSAAGRPTY